MIIAKRWVYLFLMILFYAQGAVAGTCLWKNEDGLCNEECGNVFELAKHVEIHIHEIAQQSIAQQSRERRCCWLKKNKECNVIVLSDVALRRHLRIHTGESPFSCKWCGQLFSRLSHVKQHEFRMHEKFDFKKERVFREPLVPSEESILCGRCGLSCKNNEMLKVHKFLMHLLDCWHYCDQCKLFFGDESVFLNHKHWSSDCINSSTSLDECKMWTSLSGDN